MAKPYGLANQKLCYIKMLLHTEISGKYDKEHSEEWLVSTTPDLDLHASCVFNREYKVDTE